MSQEREIEMTEKEIQRFIEMQADEGKSPLETIKALLRLVGADKMPEFKKKDK